MEPKRSVYRWTTRLIATLLLLVIGLAVAVWVLRPSLSEETVRQVVVSTIQREAPASFYITGYLDLTTAVTVKSEKRLFPDALGGLDLGTTQATVRMPGRVSYGFDVGGLRPEAIRVRPDGVVEVVVPELSVYAVEPDLEAMEVETSVGWARMQGSSGRRVEQLAIRRVREAMREQALDHVARAGEPRLNTATALEQLLAPVLQAAGLENPRFRFQVGPEVVMEPTG